MFFHGSTHKINKFTDDFVGGREAIDQEGPGIYFTSSWNNARSYGPYVYTVRLRPKKEVSTEDGKKASLREIEWLIQQAPEWESIAQNWNENPAIGLRMAAKDVLKYNDNPHQQFLQVWIDFFKYNPTEYVRGMTKLGYDIIYIKDLESVIAGEKNITHAIVLNPAIIEFMEMEDDRTEEEKSKDSLNEIRKFVRKTLQENDYRGMHVMRKDSTSSPLHDLLQSGQVAKDFYDEIHHYAYLHNKADQESVRIIKQARNKPNAIVTIYRAVPKGISEINPGDWVSLSKTYAKEHGLHHEDPKLNMPVISKKVKIKDVWWDGNDVNEFSYFPESVNESETFNEENKLKSSLLSHEQMIAMGATGALSKAFERYIPVDKIVGLDPESSDWTDDKGNIRQFKPGTKIEKSIEVIYNSGLDKYFLQNGNHRVKQAKINGDKYIRAFVQPDHGKIGSEAKYEMFDEVRIPFGKHAGHHVSDLIRMDKIEEFFKSVESDPEYNTEEPEYDWLMDPHGGYPEQTYIQNNLANGEVIFWEGWSSYCWEGLYSKPEYKGLSKENALKKIFRERTPLIAKEFDMTIKDADFFWHDAGDDDAESGYIMKIVFGVKENTLKEDFKVIQNTLEISAPYDKIQKFSIGNRIVYALFGDVDYYPNRESILALKRKSSELKLDHESYTKFLEEFKRRFLSLPDAEHTDLIASIETTSPVTDEMAAALDIPYIGNGFKKIDPSIKMKAISLKDREKIKDLLHIDFPMDGKKVICVMDDFITTGTTFKNAFDKLPNDVYAFGICLFRLRS